MDPPQHTVLLGGVGADSHSVGLTILRQALTASGFRTLYLGTHNSLRSFFAAAPLADAVLISSLDGHARHYVHEFPELMAAHGSKRPLWYIGGNLTIGARTDCESEYLEMGFRRAFVKFVDVSRLLDELRRDLSGVTPAPHLPKLWERHRPSGPIPRLTGVRLPLPASELIANRPAVLEQWPTGAQARDLEGNAGFLARQPSLCAVQRSVDRAGGEMLVQPRCGVPVLGDQIRLFHALQSSGVRVLSYQVDSLTRNNDYRAARRAMAESRDGNAALNGFPVVNYGPAVLRTVGSRLRVPVQVRHSTRDPRLLAEISFASGVTSFEGGAICYNIPYYRDLHLCDSLAMWAYVDRLVGVYQERYGVRIDREFFGTLTGTLVPPSIAIAIDLVEMLLAAAHGVTSVSLGYAEQGNRAQDVAAVRVLRARARELLRSFGHASVEVFTVYHQYMGAFPGDRARAAELIRESATTGALSGATRQLVKTTAEAIGIPTLDDNLEALALTARGIADAGPDVLDQWRVADEEAVIRAEVDCLLDRLLFAADGDLAAGVVKGFERGWIEVPFSPSIYNRGDVVTARDAEGAVRFLSVGNLPFGRELRDFHAHKMSERRRRDGANDAHGYLLVEKDVLRVPRGEYQRWPLDD